MRLTLKNPSTNKKTKNPRLNPLLTTSISRYMRASRLKSSLNMARFQRNGRNSWIITQVSNINSQPQKQKTPKMIARHLTGPDYKKYQSPKRENSIKRGHPSLEMPNHMSDQLIKLLNSSTK